MQASITVIVRTLGRDSLAQALLSVDAQQRDDVEIVLVDAAGTPPPLPPLRTPLRVVSRGQALLRTPAAALGLAAVRTRWAMFLDDDDVLLAGHLDRLAAALGAVPHAVLAYSGVELLRERQGQPERIVIDDAFEPWELLLGNRMPIHAALFDADAAARSGVTFDESLEVYEDWDFWLQMSQLGAFVHVPGVSARYVVGPSSSEVHRLAHGDEPYWRIWNKWWALAPKTWWAQALRAGEQGKAVKQELAGARQALTEAAAQREHMAQELAARHAELAAQREDLARRQSQIQSLQQALAASRIESRRAADELQAILQSTSWRLTRPLRSAVDGWRQGRQRLGRWRRVSSWRRWMTPARDGEAYAAWMATVEARDRTERAAVLTQRLAGAAARPLISVLMPVFNAGLVELDAAIVSVRAQSWPEWQLCIADDASTAPGVRERLREWVAHDSRIELVERAANGHISAATNSALALARGEWVVLLDQDDLLAASALAEVVDAAERFPRAGLIYSDEDKLDAAGRRFEPYFKPAFNVELLRGQNFINHLAAYRRDLVLELGGMREGFEGSQDHDLALRCSQRLQSEQVIHIPRVLYHWRTGPGSTAAGARDKPYAADAALRAVNESLWSSEPGALAELIAGTTLLRVRYACPQPLPAVELHSRAPLGGVADPWRQALRASTDYPALIVDGQTQAGLVLVVRPGLLPAGSGWLEELVAQVGRTGVGLAAGVVCTGQGQLLEGGVVIDPHGGAAYAWSGQRGVGQGAFGRPSLTQAFAAVTPSLMLMRAELWPLWQQTDGDPDIERALRFGAAVRGAGWRIVWTPFARLIDGAMEGGEPGEIRVDPRADDPALNANLRLDGARIVIDERADGISARPGF